MGVLLVFEPPAPTSPFDKIKIYRATSQDGTYSLIATQDATDNTYYDVNGTSSSWYKISYYDSTNDVESDLSEAVKGTAETYTTTQKVADFLQIDPFSDDTDVTVAQVVRLINRREDFIDSFTGHAWREKTASEEYHDIERNWQWDIGIPIYLRHRKIKTLKADKGDSLLVWNGGEWEEWIGNKTESRTGDYWLNYETGILFIRTRYLPRKFSIKITYRYGETEVDGDIEQACTLLVAYDLLMNEDRSLKLPEGLSGISYSERAQRWYEEAMNILYRKQEILLGYR